MQFTAMRMPSIKAAGKIGRGVTSVALACVVPEMSVRQ